MLEFSGLGGPISSLKLAAGLAASVDYPGLKLMIDSLHLARCGETPADIAALDPALIGAAQICDGPLAYPGQDAYRYEALFKRGIPGEGELPLLDFLKSIPSYVLVSPGAAEGAARARVSIQECVAVRSKVPAGWTLSLHGRPERSRQGVSSARAPAYVQTDARCESRSLAEGVTRATHRASEDPAPRAAGRAASVRSKPQGRLSVGLPEPLRAWCSG